MAETPSPQTTPQTPRPAPINGHPGAGYITQGKYKGLHWTQTPSGKKKAKLNAIKSAKTRMRNAAARAAGQPKLHGRGKQSYGGKHWTQLPGGREKMAKVQAARWKNRKADVPTTGAMKYAKGKRDVIALAVIGARQQLTYHMGQVAKLKIFLSVNAKRVESGDASE